MDLLKIGQKLGLFFEKEEKLVEIDCVIAGVFDDRLVIDLPQYFMRYIEYLDVGCPLTVKVFSKVGTLDFNTVVISSPLEEDFSVELDYNAMKLTESSDIPVIKAIETLYLKSEGISKFSKTFEISTGYVKFYSDKAYAIGDKFDCELILPKRFGNIKFMGSISEVDPVYDNEYTISFTGMTEIERQNLLYYMYIYDNSTEQE